MFQKRDQGQRIGRVGIYPYPYNVLAFYCQLHVVGRFQLPVPHRVFLHTHEGRIRVGLGITVTLSQDRQVFLVLLPFCTESFALFEHFLQSRFVMPLPRNKMYFFFLAFLR